VHRLRNVLDKLPKGLQAKAKRALHEIRYADCREDAEAELERFREEYGAKYPKAVESLGGTRTVCSASSTLRPSTGSTCGRPTRSNRRLPPSGCVSESPREPARGRRPSSWPSNCSTWRRNAGGESPHHTSSLRSEKEYHSPTELRSGTRPDQLADPQPSAVPRFLSRPPSV